MSPLDALRVLVEAAAGSLGVDPGVTLRVRLAMALLVLNVILLAAVRARKWAAPWGAFLGAGSWVLITGAGSGIGRQTALDLAGSGSSLALWDVNPGALADTAAAVAAAGATGAVVTTVVDVSDAAAVAAAAGALLARTPHRLVDVVISNAGVVTGKDVHELTDADVRRCFGVNVLASFSLLRALLPPARAARRGCFVFVSSVMGLAGSAKLADYCASKFALIGAVESLRMELARDGLRAAIPVVTVMPYAAGTGMFAGIFDSPSAWNPIRALLFPVLTPSGVSSAIVRAVVAGRTALVYVPRHMGPFVALARAAFPLPLYDVFVGWMGGWHGMTSFRGRQQAAAAAAVAPQPASAVGAPRAPGGSAASAASTAPVSPVSSAPASAEAGRSSGSKLLAARLAGVTLVEPAAAPQPASAQSSAAAAEPAPAPARGARQRASSVKPLPAAAAAAGGGGGQLSRRATRASVATSSAAAGSAGSTGSAAGGRRGR